MAGPIEFTPAEMAAFFAILGLVPPFVFAVLGFLVHLLVLGRAQVQPLPLLLRWWGWSTLAWVGAWAIAALST